MRDNTVLGEARSLIKEMEQILEDQIGVECPTCDGGRNYLSSERESGKRIEPIVHEDTCAINRARDFLGKDRL